MTRHWWVPATAFGLLVACSGAKETGCFRDLEVGSRVNSDALIQFDGAFPSAEAIGCDNDFIGFAANDEIDEFLRKNFESAEKIQRSDELASTNVHIQGTIVQLSNGKAIRASELRPID